jgi:hypothetical protein
MLAKYSLKHDRGHYQGKNNVGYLKGNKRLKYELHRKLSWY